MTPPESRTFLDLLSPAERAALASVGAARTFSAGTHLLRERDRTTFVILLLSGWCVVATDTNRGSRLILALRGPGEIVGDLAAVDRGPRSATVTALGPVEGAVIPGERFRGFLAAKPNAAAVAMQQLASRLRSSDEERRSLVAASVLQRTAARLTELAVRAGTPVADGVLIDLPLPQHDLAAYVGSTREAVAKALRLLRENGVVVTTPKRLVVRRPEPLRLLADGGSLGGDTTIPALREPV